MSDATVRVLFFAAARDAVELREVELAIDVRGTTAAALFDAIVARFPALAPYRRALRLAVNGEYARDDQPVRPGDEIAVIPPVAGG